jgi:hypothetical protein
MATSNNAAATTPSSLSHAPPLRLTFEEPLTPSHYAPDTPWISCNQSKPAVRPRAKRATRPANKGLRTPSLKAAVGTAGDGASELGATNTPNSTPFNRTPVIPSTIRNARPSIPTPISVKVKALPISSGISASRDVFNPVTNTWDEAEGTQYSISNTHPLRLATVGASTYWTMPSDNSFPMAPKQPFMEYNEASYHTCTGSDAHGSDGSHAYSDFECFNPEPLPTPYSRHLLLDATFVPTFTYPKVSESGLGGRPSVVVPGEEVATINELGPPQEALTLDATNDGAHFQSTFANNGPLMVSTNKDHGTDCCYPKPTAVTQTQVALEHQPVKGIVNYRQSKLSDCHSELAFASNWLSPLGPSPELEEFCLHALSAVDELVLQMNLKVSTHQVSLCSYNVDDEHNVGASVYLR